MRKLLVAAVVAAVLVVSVWEASRSHHKPNGCFDQAALQRDCR